MKRRPVHPGRDILAGRPSGRAVCEAFGLSNSQGMTRKQVHETRLERSSHVLVRDDFDTQGFEAAPAASAALNQCASLPKVHPQFRCCNQLTALPPGAVMDSKTLDFTDVSMAGLTHEAKTWFSITIPQGNSPYFSQINGYFRPNRYVLTGKTAAKRGGEGGRSELHRFLRGERGCGGEKRTPPSG